jgi:hypothetical protein
MLMSGSAGLAAAKRRRIVSAPPRPKSKPSTPATPKSSPATESDRAIENKLTPLQALTRHETRINDLEEKTAETERISKEMDDLKQTILKMQTFAIETSLDLTKLKKKMKTEDDHKNMRKQNSDKKILSVENE